MLVLMFSPGWLCDRCVTFRGRWCCRQIQLKALFRLCSLFLAPLSRLRRQTAIKCAHFHFENLNISQYNTFELFDQWRAPQLSLSSFSLSDLVTSGLYRSQQLNCLGDCNWKLHTKLFNIAYYSKYCAINAPSLAATALGAWWTGWCRSRRRLCGALNQIWPQSWRRVATNRLLVRCNWQLKRWCFK